MSMRESC